MNTKIDKYGAWFIVNFVICLLPLIVTLFLINNNFTIFFSSFLSYSFTLLIVNIYLFQNYLNVNTKDIIYPDFLRWFSYLVLFLILISYPIYNLSDKFNKSINDRMFVFVFAILIFDILLSFILSKPIIRRNINEQKYKDKLIKDSKIEEKAKNMKSKLEEEKL